MASKPLREAHGSSSSVKNCSQVYGEMSENVRFLTPALGRGPRRLRVAASPASCGIAFEMLSHLFEGPAADPAARNRRVHGAVRLNVDERV